MKHYVTGTLLISALLSTTAIASSGNPAKGQALFTKANCQSCHSAAIFSKPDRKIKSQQELESKVRFCDTQLDANWFDDEISDVVAYLNKVFYKFPKAQQ
ncbi:MAG: hypothetical protein KAH22_06470 [Thiotrichaceae bacterium]|nr:hypothetical protein [Thiotrichaceae bacterium]